MDNASKALIMAGAILIAVAIVGIGIYIFSSANSLTNDAVNTMEGTQVQMFNNGFYAYARDGEEILGTRARELFNYAMAQGVTLKGTAVSTANNKTTYSGSDRTKYKIQYEYTGSPYITAVVIGVNSN